MPIRRLGSLVVFLAGLTFSIVAGTAVAQAETDVGLLIGVVGGTHLGADNPTVSGIGAGGLLEVTQKFEGWRIHLEGIPRVTAGTVAAGPFGKSTAALSIINATALVDLDPHHRVRAGAGFQLINLHNYNGNNGDTNYARVTSPRYEIAADLPLPRDHFFEMSVAVLPNVRGVLYAVDITNTPEVDRPEQGAEVDYSVGYGWKRGATAYVIALRGINYKTRNTRTGGLVDSNVGAGAMFEVRFTLGGR